ncbi:MAG: NAD(P)-dependent oxidoreductase [Candidatus Saccharimonas sp.]
MSNILITGSGGQLGKALQVQYPTANLTTRATLDIANRQAVDNFNWEGIDIIINAAAYTDVDRAETTDGRLAAWAINANATANLVRACRAHDITLVHLSSDYVFDGTASLHTETEPFSPLGVYGQTKAAGDIAVCTLEKYYILRTTWVVGDGKNFIRTMLSLAEKNISPTVVSDQIGRLTFTGELARIIDHLISKKAPFGTYNATNDGPLVSWADIARRTFTLSHHQNIAVSDISTEEYFKDKESIAPRPLNSNLSLDKLHATGFKSKDWQEDLQSYIIKETKI